MYYYLTLTKFKGLVNRLIEFRESSDLRRLTKTVTTDDERRKHHDYLKTKTERVLMKSKEKR
jgi:hypothetical protein